MAMCAGPLLENIDNRPVSDGVTFRLTGPALPEGFPEYPALVATWGA